MSGSSSGHAGRQGVETYDYTLFGEVEERPLDTIRQIIGRRMSASWQNVPHVTHHDEADITDLERWRHEQNAGVAGDGVRITPLAYIIKACLEGLKKFPDFNSSLDETGKKVLLKRYFNIGMAVDTPMGLIVPVLKGVDAMSIAQIAAGAADLSDRARNGKLGFADAEGATFTVTSLGKLGGHRVHPDHQRSGSGNHGRLPRQGEAGRPRRRGGGPHDAAAIAVLRSSRHRRGDGGPVHGPRPRSSGTPRGSGLSGRPHDGSRSRR